MKKSELLAIESGFVITEELIDYIENNYETGDDEICIEDSVYRQIAESSAIRAIRGISDDPFIPYGMPDNLRSIYLLREVCDCLDVDIFKDHRGEDLYSVIAECLSDNLDFRSFWQDSPAAFNDEHLNVEYCRNNLSDRILEYIGISDDCDHYYNDDDIYEDDIDLDSVCEDEYDFDDYDDDDDDDDELQ